MPYLVGYLSWSLAYKYIGFGVSCYAVIFFLFLKTPPKSLQNAEKYTFINALKFVFKNRNLRLIALAGFFLLWSEMSLVVFANTYLKDFR